MAIIKRLGLMLGIAAAGCLVASPAHAASWHAISGTVYSPCSGQIWYKSTTPRTKAGDGAIKLQFSNLNPGGVTWKLIRQNGTQLGVTQSWTGTEEGITRRLASNVNGGVTFYNMFKEYDGRCGYGNYSFDGSEYY
jgi:hypothetical protein